MKMLPRETAIFEIVVLSYLRRECERNKKRQKRKRKSKSNLSTNADGGNVE